MSHGGSGLEPLLSSLVRDVPDFPEPGIVFKDISPLLGDHDGFARVVDALAQVGRNRSGESRIDKVAGIEARGFILAGPVALVLGAGVVPIRKAGKLPRATYQLSYALEYGEATLEVHRDAFVPGDRVLVVDDVLATGGTMATTFELIERCGASVEAGAVVIELGFLEGRTRLGGRTFDALHTV
jgi:adenine phosphoribosyltransferase